MLLHAYLVEMFGCNTTGYIYIHIYFVCLSVTGFLVGKSFVVYFLLTFEGSF